MLLLWLLVLVIGTLYLMHRRLPPLQILGIVAVYTLLMGIFSKAPGWLLVVVWLVIALNAALVLLPEWRRKVFTGPVFKWFKRTLPPMSQTEREAIDAGTVWWDGELFSGRPDWRTLLAYPAPMLTEEEQAFLDGPTEALCAMVSDW
ncbi:acyl-CoA dehydrogenase, partial [Escherichia coli]|nr:acyl-CoA dehydrogenase [Escherichia coli]